MSDDFDDLLSEVAGAAGRLSFRINLLRTAIAGAIELLKMGAPLHAQRRLETVLADLAEIEALNPPQQESGASGEAEAP